MIALLMAISRSAWSTQKQTKANIPVIIHPKNQGTISVLARVSRKIYKARVAKRVFSFSLIPQSINIGLLDKKQEYAIRLVVSVLGRKKKFTKSLAKECGCCLFKFRQLPSYLLSQPYQKWSFSFIKFSLHNRKVRCSLNNHKIFCWIKLFFI